MEWKKLADEKPEHDSAVMVMNAKWSRYHKFEAIYHHDCDCFILYDPERRGGHPVLEVTHWFEIPSLYPERLNEKTSKEDAKV